MPSASASPSPSRTPSQRRRFTVDALFTDTRPRATGVADLPTAKEIRLDRIVPDPDQPRRSFDPEKLEELAASIESEGVLQPIVVRYDERDDIYVIVHGERRWRASRQARLESIPAIVREISEDRKLIHQLMENIVREDLNAIDRAAALRALKQQMGDAPWESVADAVAIKRSRLFQLLGTEKLPEPIQDDIRAGRLSEKQSRALQGLPVAAQLALRDAIIADGLSASDAMALARRLKTANIGDNPELAALKIVEFRSAPPNQRNAPSRFDDPQTLLDLIATTAKGDAPARTALSEAVSTSRIGPVDAMRLEAQVLDLARSLARLASDDRLPDAIDLGDLSALHRALGALLDTQPATR
jgi:ParB family transcriptional regulator, chromosome partitioning protein